VYPDYSVFNILKYIKYLYYKIIDFDFIIRKKDRGYEK